MSDFSFPDLAPALAALRGGLVVSCQAQAHEPLFGAEIMARMAIAARAGGAVGIRSNTPVDVAAIRRAVPDLPLIGLFKVVVPGFDDVYITPRLEDAVAVADAGADIIALDATLRPHPRRSGDVFVAGTTAELIREVKQVTGKLVMADIDNVASAIAAAEAGADVISTTLSGYTPDSPALDGPDFELIRQLIGLNLPIPVVAEGRIHSPEQARAALDAGAYAVVVGGAITRPQQITERFAAVVRGRA
jgi:N-acylglucosamine-6-phosphate 2-epimerase